jgi:hypothetical protein
MLLGEALAISRQPDNRPEVIRERAASGARIDDFA